MELSFELLLLSVQRVVVKLQLGTVLLELLDRGLVGIDGVLQVQLLGLVQLGGSLELDVLFLELLDGVLLLLEGFLLLHELGLELHDPLVEGGLGHLELVDLLLSGLYLLGELFLLSHELVNSVVLSERETRTLLDDLVELADLILEALDDLPGLLLSALGLLDELPALLNLSPEDSDGVRVLLSELDGSLDPCCILQDSVVKLLASRK